MTTLTDEDRLAVDSFRNFLSWSAKPVSPRDKWPARPVPPAWFAYALGLTRYCPPAGEL